MTKDVFIRLATHVGIDNEELREDLCNLYENIHKNIDCAHGHADSYYMADFILRYQSLQGPIVEFGCYQGGLSCKLSYLAGLLGKEYIIFDTFEGLPTDATYRTFNPDASFLGVFKKNQFSCSKEEVKNNLQKYGNIFITKIHDGNIETILPSIDLLPSFVFIDVDIFSTANFIIKNIWDKMTCPALFTHESCLVDYVAAIMKLSFWEENFKQRPPKMGHTYQEENYGLKNADCLNFLVKDDSIKSFADAIKFN
jgi:O-methyltransferase